MDESDTKIYIGKDGTKEYRNSKGYLHRLNDPAIEYINGDKFWYKEGLCHRVDGPAWEWADGDKRWYLLFKELEEKEFNSWIFRIQKYI